MCISKASQYFLVEDFQVSPVFPAHVWMHQSPQTVFVNSSVRMPPFYNTESCRIVAVVVASLVVGAPVIFWLTYRRVHRPNKDATWLLLLFHIL